jgi:hypothetical protein
MRHTSWAVALALSSVVVSGPARTGHSHVNVAVVATFGNPFFFGPVIHPFNPFFFGSTVFAGAPVFAPPPVAFYPPPVYSLHRRRITTRRCLQRLHHRRAAPTGLRTAARTSPRSLSMANPNRWSALCAKARMETGIQFSSPKVSPAPSRGQYR